MPDTDKNFRSGPLPDLRSLEEKQRDYNFNELVSAPNPVSWVTKKRPSVVNMVLGPTLWRKFKVQRQAFSGSCVAQTMRKLMGILYYLSYGKYVDFSATDIYRRRINRPQPGMGGPDVFSIAQQGVTLNELQASDNLSDEQMDSQVVDPPSLEVGKVFRIDKWVTVPIRNLETIASIIQTTGKGVMVWIFWKAFSGEYSEVPQIKAPALTPYEDGVNRHSVAAVDFTLYQGKPALIIDESSGDPEQRIFTRSWFESRNYFAAYPMTFRFQAGATPLPPAVFQFTKDLYFIPVDVDGDISNPELDALQREAVSHLQDILRHEGFFPVNIASTGYYGAVTARGVLAYQKRYSIAPVEELEALQGRTVGPKTRSKLNSI